MKRAAPTTAVTAKMYRHFAFITVAITASLAVFADGEQRQAIEENIAQKKQNQELVETERELARQGKGGNSGLNLKIAAETSGSFGSDAGTGATLDVSGADYDPSDSDYGPAPSVASSYTRSADYIPVDDEEMEDVAVNAAPSSVELAKAPPPGMTPQEFAQYKKQLERKSGRK